MGDAAAAEIASFLRAWAVTELRGYCPLYERLALGLADDEALLARVAAVTAREKIVPVLLFAAVKLLVDREPASVLGRLYAGAGGDPWPAFRALVEARFDEVAALLATRRIQTNEVGRAAALLPALAWVAARTGRPLALVEIGPSAGLNLLLDRFAYDYGPRGTAGDSGSAVRLVCAPLGPLGVPVPARVPRIAARCGIDLAPVDVTDEAQCRWLEACCWPDPPERIARLRAALALARRTPPRIHRGDVLDVLPAVLADLPDDAVPCLVSTWVLAYLSAGGRERLREIVAAAGARHAVAVVTAEYEGMSPFVPPPPRPVAGQEGRVGTLLGASLWLDGVPEARALAWMQAHGAWIDWLDPETAA